jgi:adenosine deaminase
VRPIPPPLIEICPSTSYFVLNLSSFADHPYIRKYHSLHYPFSLYTDDTAIFNTTITQEILHMKNALDWTMADVIQIQGKII